MVLRHRLGTDPADDAEVLTEPDERFWLGVGRQPRRGAGSCSAPAASSPRECRLLQRRRSRGHPAGGRAASPGRRVRRRAGRRPAADRAQRRRAGLRAGLGAAGRDQPRAVDAGAARTSPGVRILGVARLRPARRRLAASRRADRAARAAPRRAPATWTRAGTTSPFDEPLYDVDAVGGPEYDTDTIRVGYESMVTPDSVYDYELDTGELHPAQADAGARRADLGPYDPDELRAGARLGDRRGRHPGPAVDRPPRRRRRWTDRLRRCSTATARTRSRSTRRFSIPRLSLLDRGVVFAIAHVRGGGELGRGWYEHGKTAHQAQHLHRLRRVRADFLVEQGYTSTDRLAAAAAAAPAAC